MANRKMQDMVPGSKRSIRNVPLRYELSDDEKERKPEKVVKHVPPEPPKKVHRKTKSGGGKYRLLIVFVIVLASLAIIAAAVSMFFSTGTITIKPKSVTIDVKTDLQAKSKTSIGSATSTFVGLTYDTIVVNESQSVQVPAIFGATIDKKASGTVILYNAFSTASQKIIQNTRIAGKNGLVYRTLSTVVVPGMTGNTPGSIAVKVSADQAGSVYNLALSESKEDLQLLGYVGSPKFGKYYARLKTDITGGYSGKQVTADPVELKKAEATMKKEMLTKLLVSAKNQTPSGYVFFDSAYKVEYDPIQSSVGEGATANVSMKGRLYAYTLGVDDLLKAFAKDQVNQFPTNSYKASGMESLNFVLSTSTASLNKKDTISFKLTGKITLVGTFPVDTLAKELAGVSLEDSASVIRRYGGIGGAHAKIFPVWMRSLPDSSERIHIEVEGN